MAYLYGIRYTMEENELILSLREVLSFFFPRIIVLTIV
jgi:hypothetical protein